MTNINGQITETVPVLDQLRTLEKAFPIKFSYYRRALKQLECEPVDTLDLTSALAQLETNCGLQFFNIDQRYIAVRTTGDEIISICGTILNTDTGAPLAGASVVTADYQIPTGVSGNFTIPSIAAGERIAIYYQGFKVQELLAKDIKTTDPCKQIFIEQIFNFLPTVELDAYLTKGISRSTEGTISISDANFEILPSLVDTDVLKIVQILPGVESFSETASSINIRGGAADQSLLLWDDNRMYQTGHFFGLISAFNPNLTRNVQVYKNGTHPRFGATVSGVISMNSDIDIPEDVDGSVAIDFTSLNGFAKIPFSEKFAAHISGRTSINTGLGNPVYDAFFDRVFQNTVITDVNDNTELGRRSTDESFNFYDINTKLVWEPTKKDLLTYSFLTIFNKLEFTERFTGETSLLRNDSELKQRTVLNTLHWDRSWSGDFKTTLRFGDSEFINNRGVQNLETQALRTQGNEINETSFKADLYYAGFSVVDLQAGYDYSSTDISYSDSPFETSEVFTQSRTLKTNGLFLNSKWKFFDQNTLLNAGLRYVNYDIDDTSFAEPRVSVFQRLTNSWSLNASFEMKSQPILSRTEFEDNILGIPNERWLIADGTNNAILESEQYAAGISYKSSAWIFSLEAFQKDIDGLNVINQGFRNQLEGLSLSGNNRIQGIEFSSNYKSENFNAWLSYTYMDNVLSIPEFSEDSFLSNLGIEHSVNAALAYTWKSLVCSLGFTYHSGIPYTRPIDGEEIIVNDGVPIINFGPPNSDTLDPYFRTDFSAKYSLDLDTTFKGEISLGLLNIFNRKNVLNTYYLIEESSEGAAELNQVQQRSLGFTPNLALRVMF